MLFKIAISHELQKELVRLANSKLPDYDEQLFRRFIEKVTFMTISRPLS